MSDEPPAAFPSFGAAFKGSGFCSDTSGKAGACV